MLIKVIEEILALQALLKPLKGWHRLHSSWLGVLDLTRGWIEPLRLAGSLLEAGMGLL